MARLAGPSLLCDVERGRGRCRGIIGGIVEVEDQGHVRRVFAVPPGWRKFAGIWEEPERDRDRRVHGHGPRPLPSRLALNKHGRSGPALAFPAFVVNRREDIRCGECGVVQSVCVDDLGVDRSDHISALEL